MIDRDIRVNSASELFFSSLTRIFAQRALDDSPSFCPVHCNTYVHNSTGGLP